MLACCPYNQALFIRTKYGTSINMSTPSSTMKQRLARRRLNKRAAARSVSTSLDHGVELSGISPRNMASSNNLRLPSRPRPLNASQLDAMALQPNSRSLFRKTPNGGDLTLAKKLSFRRKSRMHTPTIEVPDTQEEEVNRGETLSPTEMTQLRSLFGSKKEGSFRMKKEGSFRMKKEGSFRIKKDSPTGSSEEDQESLYQKEAQPPAQVSPLQSMLVTMKEGSFRKETEGSIGSKNDSATGSLVEKREGPEEARPQTMERGNHMQVRKENEGSFGSKNDSVTGSLEEKRQGPKEARPQTTEKGNHMQESQKKEGSFGSKNDSATGSLAEKREGPEEARQQTKEMGNRMQVDTQTTERGNHMKVDTQSDAADEKDLSEKRRATLSPTEMIQLRSILGKKKDSPTDEKPSNVTLKTALAADRHSNMTTSRQNNLEKDAKRTLSEELVMREQQMQGAKRETHVKQQHDPPGDVLEENYESYTEEEEEDKENVGDGPFIYEPRKMWLTGTIQSQGEIEELFVEMAFFARLGFVQPPSCLRCVYREAIEKQSPDQHCKRWIPWRKNANIALHPDRLDDNLVLIQCQAAKSLVEGEEIQGQQWDSVQRQLVGIPGQ